jgi:hypothetical protein
LEHKEGTCKLHLDQQVWAWKCGMHLGPTVKFQLDKTKAHVKGQDSPRNFEVMKDVTSTYSNFFQIRTKNLRRFWSIQISNSKPEAIKLFVIWEKQKEQLWALTNEKHIFDTWNSYFIKKKNYYWKLIKVEWNSHS